MAATEPPFITIHSYCMKDVWQKIQSSPVIEKPVTIQDLKMEINFLKIEIKHLQTATQTMQTEIYQLKTTKQKIKDIAPETSE